MGLGSKVSTCDMPPFMNRKIILFARGAKCGAFGASEDDCPVAVASPPNAIMPKPLPMRRSASRRVSGGKVGSMSIDKAELIRTQKYLDISRPRGIGRGSLNVSQEADALLQFRGGDLARKEEPVGAADPRCVVVRLPLEPR